MKKRNIFSRYIAATLAALIFSFSCITTAAALTPELNIASDAYVVIDASSGQVLIEKNMSKRKAPASITKIMTLALALEKGNFDDTITVSREAVTSIEPGSTHISLVPGEVITFRDAVMGTQLISANDAANVVAEYSGGSIANFVLNMNLKVEELGLHDTHFANPNGLDANGHYVTAYDMAQITRYALTVPGFREVFGSTEYQMPQTNIKARNWVFYAQNSILFPDNKEYYPDITGGKLGYTYNANHTIVALAKRGGMEMIVVALDSQGNAAQYSDAKKLFDYCFEHFESMTIGGKELRSSEIPIANAERPTGMVSVSSEGDHTFAVPLGTTRSSLEIRYNLPDLYKSERKIDPSFSVYSATGQLLYTAKLNYKVLPVEQSVTAVPTERISKTDYFKDLMLVAVKCLLVVFGVFMVIFLAVRCFVMIRYKIQKQAALRRKREMIIRKKEAIERSRHELHTIELANATLQHQILHPGATSGGIPNNVTHIYPNQIRNHGNVKTHPQRNRDIRK